MSSARKTLFALNIRPSYSVLYSRCVDQERNKGSFGDRKKSLPWDLSRKAAMRIKNAIEWMLLFSHKKEVYSKRENKKFSFVLNFITLTLSSTQMHSDQEIIEKLLQPFLDWFRLNYSNMYVWKAEVQQNGNIHFHITTNVFIHWKTIRKKWNKLQAKHGYHRVYDHREQLGANSIDVHAVKNEEETSSYMAKYMMKHGKDEPLKKSTEFFKEHFYLDEIPVPQKNKDGKAMIAKRRLHCRIWACSENLSNLSLRAIHQKDNRFPRLLDETRDHSEKRIPLDFADLYVHRHLKYQKRSPVIKSHLSDIYRTGDFRSQTQKHFTIWSLKSQDPLEL